MRRLEKIDAIARKSPHMITEEEKAYIVKTSAKMGIEFVPRPHCNNCYSDQAIILRRALTAKTDDTRKYLLKDGVDVIFMGQRVNNDTLTDQLAKQLLADGFARYLFSKCE